MKIDSSHLFRLPVRTEDGRRLGHVVGLVLSTDTHDVLHYRVCPDQCTKNLFHRRRAAELLIAPEQVLAITNEALVVDSAFARDVLPARVPRHAMASARVAPTTSSTSASAS